VSNDDIIVATTFNIVIIISFVFFCPIFSKTWIMPGKPMVGCRFDRIYHNYHPANTTSLHFQSLHHVGTQVIPSVGMTPSDHFGLVLQLELELELGSGSEERGQPRPAPAGLVVGVVKAKGKASRGSADVSASVSASVSAGKKRNISGEVCEYAAPISSSSFSSSTTGANSSFSTSKVAQSQRLSVGGGGNRMVTASSREEEEEEEDDADMKLALKLSMELMKGGHKNMSINTCEHELHHAPSEHSHRHRAAVSRSSQPREAGAAMMGEKERRRALFLKGLDRRSANHNNNINTLSAPRSGALCREIQVLDEDNDDAGDDAGGDCEKEKKKNNDNIEIIELSD
jgi:hypothetical protein